jgi:hypothetical protein
VLPSLLLILLRAVIVVVVAVFVFSAVIAAAVAVEHRLPELALESLEVAQLFNAERGQHHPAVGVMIGVAGRWRGGENGVDHLHELGAVDLLLACGLGVVAQLDRLQPLGHLLGPPLLHRRLLVLWWVTTTLLFPFPRAFLSFSLLFLFCRRSARSSAEFGSVCGGGPSRGQV